MNDADREKTGWKQKLVHEAIEYWINFIYLGSFFGAFIWYRRLILAEFQISYLHYGIALLKAAVLAKVIMIGDVFHLGRRLENMPLIFPTILKAVLFSVWVLVFEVIEHTIVGIVHGKGLAGGLDEMISKGWDEVLAWCLIMFVAFIPLFAYKEIGRVLGMDKMRGLLFRKRATT